jgi:membrane AbrB-like protein
MKGVLEMSTILQFFLFIGIASLGGLVGNYLRIPIGTLIGAMFAVGLSKHFSLLSFQSSTILSFFVQMLLGIMFGLSFIKLTKAQLKKLLISFSIIILSVVIMGAGTGFVVSKLTFIDSGLSILASAPGGIPEMAMTAKALRLDAPVVVVIHLIRVILVMSVFTFLLNYYYRKEKLIDFNKVEKRYVNL